MPERHFDTSCKTIVQSKIPVFDMCNLLQPAFFYQMLEMAAKEGSIFRLTALEGIEIKSVSPIEVQFSKAISLLKHFCMPLRGLDSCLWTFLLVRFWTFQKVWP